MLNIKRVGVIGAGTIGNGIAQVFTQARFDVRLIEITPSINRAEFEARHDTDCIQGPARAQGMIALNDALGDLVKKGLITPAEALTRSLDKTAMTTLLNRKTA